MFRSARLKLTAWYLIIIMLISAAFSVAIYLGVTGDLNRRFQMMEHRMMLRRHRGVAPQVQDPPAFTNDLRAAKQGIATLLLTANGIILILSAGAGYLLAGLTLRPIENSMEEQKRFVADASHELRTPLTALKSQIEVALRDSKISKKEATEILGSNLEEVEKLESLASDLLSLAHYEQGEREFALAEADAGALAEGAYKKIDPIAAAKSVQVTPKIDSVSARVNKSSVEQLIVILLDNAVKYTPSGGEVTLAIRADKRGVEIEVADTGVGISSDETPHIFDRFYRADRARSKTSAPGFGLGLAIAKKITVLHHGSINVESRPGEGTTFTVTLPDRS